MNALWVMEGQTNERMNEHKNAQTDEQKDENYIQLGIVRKKYKISCFTCMLYHHSK